MKIILESKTGIFRRSWTKNTDTSGKVSFQSVVENKLIHVHMYLHVCNYM